MNSQSLAPISPMTLNEYLAFDRHSPVRHEFVEGELYAFAGASRRHSRIISNVVYRFVDASIGTSCEVHSNDVKLQAGDQIIYYPDVMVVCDPDDDDALIVSHPCLVVEVVSPSSWRTDRGEKLIVYRQVPSLQAYLIVNQDERRVISNVRQSDGEWRQDEYTGDATISLPCIDIELGLNDIYRGLE